ncbi:MAG: proline--tRNA ligase [Fibrobacteres bacterium]|nr:proline--tRNA ligase [Fibrobacterota bacterium]
MLITHLIGKRFKDKPAEASFISHSILLRGGYIRQVSNGIYSLLPLGLRVIRKIENIIREEMVKVGGQEVLMPVVLPRELWDESGRYDSIGSELLRFKDRTAHDMVLAMTHEEGVVHLSRNEVNSYKDYPFMLFQIQTKFRDEPRSRGGLIRVREFTMKDAYSFHNTDNDLQNYYDKCAEAYSKIFSRAGLPQVAKVESDSGMMGGRVAHEYMLLVDSGEDTVVKCDSCDYVSNLEVATSKREKKSEEPLPLQLVHTPEKKTIEEVSDFLKVPKSKLAKVVIYEGDSNAVPVIAVIRGDLAVNESKISKLMGVAPIAATEKTIQTIGTVAGFASAMNVSNCRIIIDYSVIDSSNLVCGGNKTDYHYLNFNAERDVPVFETADIATVTENSMCPKCSGILQFKRGIEVGNIFQLGTKYTEKMGMRYLDSEGQSKTPIMGCYGIGVGRLMASIIEASHDDYGPIWPSSVAPFSVHIITIGLSDKQLEEFSDPVYESLKSEKIEVLYDNRDERAGAKFADADLIGAPLKLIFGGKNFESKMVEWKRRDGKDKGLCKVSEIMDILKSI